MSMLMQEDRDGSRRTGSVGRLHACGSLDRLSPTDRELAGLVARGFTNREIATCQYLSPRTIEAKLSRIYARLGVRSRYELARLARPVETTADLRIGRSPGPDRLSLREQEIASLVADGWSNRAVAEHLGISVRTIENHLISVFRKLRISSRLDLVRLVRIAPGTSTGREPRLRDFPHDASPASPHDR